MIPAYIYSVLGWVPVKRVKSLKSGDTPTLGLTMFDQREVSIEEQISDVTALATYGHELAHIMLWDGGVHQVLSEKQLEAVCDAFATWFASAVQNGAIELRTPAPPPQQRRRKHT